MNLNHKPLRKCYAFELGYIVRNRREDGFHGSFRRQAAAENVLEARARLGDPQAAATLRELADERQS